MVAVGRRAGHPALSLRGDRDGRRGAATDHEMKWDYRAGRAARYLCCGKMRACMRHYSIWPGNYAIVVPPQFAHALRARRLVEGRYSRICLPPRPHSSPRMGRLRQNALWSAIKATASIRHCRRRIILLVIAAGGPAGGFGAVIPPWFWKKPAKRSPSQSRLASTAKSEHRLRRILNDMSNRIPRSHPRKTIAASFALAPRLSTLEGAVVAHRLER